MAKHSKAQSKSLARSANSQTRETIHWTEFDTPVGTMRMASSERGVVYLELPEAGARVDKDEPFGVIESTKAVSDIFAPLSGKVLDVNSGLLEEPAPVNASPYEDGWLLKIEVEDAKELEDLMDGSEYDQYLKEEA